MLTGQCVGTHGIAWDGPAKAVMIECSNPPTCAAPYTDSTKCSGSTWVIDSTIASWTPPLSITTPARYRMVSPALSSLYGANTGIRGQIWDDPTYSIHVVPNTNLVSS